MFKKLFIIILIIGFIGFIAWYAITRNRAKDTTTAESPTATSTLVLRLPILQHGSDSATSTPVYIGGNTPSGNVNNVPVSNVGSSRPVSTIAAPAPQGPVSFSSPVLGFSAELPVNTYANVYADRAEFMQDGRKAYGVVEVFPRGSENLDTIEKRVRLGVDITSVERVMVGNRAGIFYQSRNWQSNGLVVISGDRVYYIYGALLQNKIRKTFLFF